jgi:hypothetical protein
LGFLGAIGLTLDAHDLGAMHEAVHEGDDASGVGEDLAPACKYLVRCHDGAVVLIAAADELEEQVGVAVGVGEVADLID